MDASVPSALVDSLSLGKVCTKCGAGKPLEGFARAKRGKCGRAAHCKSCRNKEHAARRHANLDGDRERRRRNTRAYYSANRDRVLAKSREWAKANRERIRANRLRSQYGIPRAFYEYLLKKQGGTCAICGVSETEVDGQLGKPKELGVDHDHRCCPGKKSCGRCIRGLLCRLCNNGLGMFRDDATILRRAIDYLAGVA